MAMEFLFTSFKKLANLAQYGRGSLGRWSTWAQQGDVASLSNELKVFWNKVLGRAQAAGPRSGLWRLIDNTLQALGNLSPDLQELLSSLGQGAINSQFSQLKQILQAPQVIRLMAQALIQYLNEHPEADSQPRSHAKDANDALLEEITVADQQSSYSPWSRLGKMLVELLFMLCDPILPVKPPAVQADKAAGQQQNAKFIPIKM